MTSRPIRVCFLIDTLLPAGTELQMLSLIRRLDRDVVRPYLCVLDGEDPVSRSLEPADCPVIRLGVCSLGSITAMRQAWRFARFLRRERIEILQVYFVDSTTFGAVVGRLAGVRHVLRVRNNVGHWMTPGLRRRFRWMSRLITAVVTNSQAGIDALVEQEGIAANSVLVVENGIDLDRFPVDRDPERFRRPGKRRVGIVANWRHVKGLDIFLEAAARVRAVEPDVTFAIAGGLDGEDLWPDLDRRASAPGLLGHIEFLGRVTDVPSFLQTLHVAVLSSRAEGTSNALIEYMAAGLPIVATAVGGNVELIHHGVDGLLVPPEDPAALGDAIARLLRDPGEATRLGRAARAAVEARFGLDAFARTYEDVYLGL